MSEIRPTTGWNTQRIEAFSDGVFAVTITLLVLIFQVPELAASVVSQELVAQTADLCAQFRVRGHLLGRASQFLPLHPTVWSHLALAQHSVADVHCVYPFPTALVGEYPQQRISIVIYGGMLVITALVLQLLLGLCGW